MSLEENIRGLQPVNDVSHAPYMLDREMLDIMHELCVVAATTAVASAASGIKSDAGGILSGTYKYLVSHGHVFDDPVRKAYALVTWDAGICYE